MSPTSAPRGREWAWFALTAVVFSASYAMLPLYSSNQNHHFLVGIARAEGGWLRGDWLVHTVDPFPVFSAFVEVVHRARADVLFYAIYGLLFGAYGYGLIGIVEHVVPGRAGREVGAAERLAFLAVLCVLHNEVIGYLAGVGLPEMPWWQMTHWGVAEQEIFGHSAFQASSFGMLLPLAIRWFLERRPLAATALMGGVLVLHFSYVLMAGGLTLAFMLIAWRRSGRIGPPALVGGIALACALPVLAYVLARLGPSTPEVSRAAADILVRHIPQETTPSHWLGPKAWAQVGLMLGGLGVAAGGDALLILLVPFLVGLALTAAQFTSGSPQLALLFPWRVSVLLVPVSTALLVRVAVAWLFGRLGAAGARRSVFVSATVLAVSSLLGVVRMTLNFAYFYDDRAVTAVTDRIVPAWAAHDFARALRPDTLPTMRFVRATVGAADLYVVPPDLERFRLVAGAPILADRKSHPYKDVEVIEWRRRLDAVEAFYASEAPCEDLKALAAAYAVTHVVVGDRLRPLSCPDVSPIYEDDAFEVYRITRSANARINDSDDGRSR